MRTAAFRCMHVKNPERRPRHRTTGEFTLEKGWRLSCMDEWSEVSYWSSSLFCRSRQSELGMHQPLFAKTPQCDEKPMLKPENWAKASCHAHCRERCSVENARHRVSKYMPSSCCVHLIVPKKQLEKKEDPTCFDVEHCAGKAVADPR